MQTSDHHDPVIDPEFAAMAEQLATKVKDATYTVVGLGVLGFQRLQVQRQQLRHRIAGEHGRPGIPADELRAVLVHGAHQLDGWLESTRSLVDSRLEPIEDQLPTAARELVARGRSLGIQLHQLLQSVA